LFARGDEQVPAVRNALRAPSPRTRLRALPRSQINSDANHTSDDARNLRGVVFISEGLFFQGKTPIVQ
jgi:hypothetical protein